MHPHKVLGIIGGMGAYAGAWLFNRITNLTPATDDQDHLEVIVHSNSSIPDRTKAILAGESYPLPELLRSVKLINTAGADVLAMACMSAHYYREEVSKAFDGVFVDAIEVAAQEVLVHARQDKSSSVGLIGSSGLLKSQIFQNVFKKEGLDVILLSEADQQEYFMGPLYEPGGIKSRGISQGPGDRFRKQVDILYKQGADIILGACSEVPLLINSKDSQVPFVDAFESLAIQLTKICYSKNSL